MNMMFNGVIPMPDHLVEDSEDGIRNDALAPDFAYMPNMIMQGMAHAGAIPMDARMDDAFGGNSVIFALQTQYMLKRIINRPYPDMKARRLIPQTREVPVGATSFAFPIYDQIGEVKPIANYADDLPSTSVIAEKHFVEPVDLGSSFQYSIRDIEVATMGGYPLAEREAVSNRDISERKYESIAFNGEPEAKGVYGLLTHPNITKTTAPNGASGGSAWSGKTALEIYDDLVSIVVQQTQDTNEVERPDTYIMSLDRFLIANTRTFNDVTGQSAMTRFKERFPEITIETSVYMKAENNSLGQNVLVGYKKDSNKLSMESPLSYTVLPPQYRNLAMIFNSRYLTYGVVVYFPKSISVLEGI